MSLDIETNIRRHINYNTNYMINIIGIQFEKWSTIYWCDARKIIEDYYC